MSGFNINDYVSVSERIKQFIKQFPDGSLQSELTRLEDGWLCKGYAYRTADDDRPGIGHAFEPVPGKTPYTRDSEAQNAETSAWGRAIVALGFETKNIASAEEVQARRPDEQASTNGGEKATETQKKRMGALISEADKASMPLPDPKPPMPAYESWDDYSKRYATAHFGVQSRADLTKDQMSKLIDHLATATAPF